MKTTAVVSLVLLVMAVAPSVHAQAPARDARPVAVAGTAVIRGRVVTADISSSGVASGPGRPISLATITASAPELREPRSISTNAEGRYELRNLPAGHYTLTVSRAGYLSLQYGQRRVFELGTPIQVPEGTTINDVDFVLPRMSVISGRIVDEEGEPFAGALVHAVQSTVYSDGRRFTSMASGHATTDDSGAYRITGLSPGSYTVMTDTWGVTWTAIEAGVKRTHGYVPTYFPGVSSASSARAVGVGLGEEVSNVDFPLIAGRPASITGTLIDSRVQPMPCAIVTIVREVGAVGLGGSVSMRNGGLTTSDGAFTIPNLTPGEIMLIAGPSPGRPGQAAGEAALETVVVDGDDLNVVLTTSSGWSAAGRIVADTGPLPPAVRDRAFVGTLPVQTALLGVRVGNVGGPDQGRPSPEGTFQVSGIFGPVRIWITGLPDGWIVKEILHDGRDVAGKPIEGRNAESISGLQVVLSNRATKIRGPVTDANGTPAAGGTVLVFADDGDKWFVRSPYVRAVRPNKDGRYEIQGLPPGDYLAIAVDYATDRMWNDAGYLESLRGGATKVSLGDGASPTLALKVVAP